MQPAATIQPLSSTEPVQSNDLIPAAPSVLADAAMPNLAGREVPKQAMAEVIPEPVKPVTMATPVSDVTVALARVFVTWLIELIRGERMRTGNGIQPLVSRGICGEEKAAELVALIPSGADDVPEIVIDSLVNSVITDMENRAITSKGQDAFALMAKNRWHITRDDGRRLYKALRQTLAAVGQWPVDVGGKLQQQAEGLTDDRVARRQDPEKGQAQKQLKRDSAANSNGSWVQIARRIARELAQNGPISVDDVTEAMSRTHKVAPGEGDGPHNWKGSIFTTSEWVTVGTIPSRLPEAHGRTVTLWALKTWLTANTLNGRGDIKSAFDLVKLFNEFKRAHPAMGLERCNWYIGDERLASDVRDSMASGGNKLYGIPVCFIPGAVGAVILPPDYAQTPKK